MLKNEQLEGLHDLLDAVRGVEENDNTARREQMKRFARLAVETGLTRRQREVMLLIYGEGLSGREAAERLGLCESAVSARKRRALDRIRGLAKYLQN